MRERAEFSKVVTMIKQVCSLIVILTAATPAFAQSHYYDRDIGAYVESEPSVKGASVEDLKEELARERYKTQIVMERRKRAQYEHEQEYSEYNNRMREVEYERSQQELENRGRTNQIYSVNQGVNVIGNIIRSAQMIKDNW